MAENALRQVQKQERRWAECGRELLAVQRERDTKTELFRKALQRIVEELEAKCQLWLTSSDEVEKARVLGV